MNHRIPSIIICLTISILSACKEPAPAPAPFDETAEKKALLETIELETRSFFTNDSVSWKSCYIQTDEASSAWNNQEGTFDTFRGFPTIEAYAFKSMRENPIDTANLAQLQIQYRNVQIHFFSPDAAFVQYNQYISDSEGKNYHQTYDERIMLKESGKWKIRNVTSIWNYKNKLPIDSLK